MFGRWLRDRRRPESPIPDAAQRLIEQSDELQKVVRELKRQQAARAFRERKA